MIAATVAEYSVVSSRIKAVAPEPISKRNDGVEDDEDASIDVIDLDEEDETRQQDQFEQSLSLEHVSMWTRDAVQIESTTITHQATSPSRNQLRRSIQRRGKYLTPQERGYLERLYAEGDEVEVMLASQKLLDSDLFFNEDDKNDDDNEGGTWNQQDGHQRTDEDESIPPSVESVYNTDAFSKGSERRQVQLEQRKKENQVFGQMWKAHEVGLAVSQEASRRRASLIQLSASHNLSQYLFQVDPADLGIDEAESTTTFATHSVRQTRRTGRASLRLSCLSKGNPEHLLGNSYNLGMESNRSSVSGPSSNQSMWSASESNILFQDDDDKTEERLESTTAVSRMRARSSVRASNPDAMHVSSRRSSAMSSSFHNSFLSGSSHYHHYQQRGRRISAASCRSSGAALTSVGTASRRCSTRRSGSTQERRSLVNFKDDVAKLQSILSNENALPADEHREPIEVEEKFDYYEYQQRKPAKFSPPVLMRRASSSLMDEEGIEVADLKNESENRRDQQDPRVLTRMASLLNSEDEPITNELRRASSFDETKSFQRMDSMFRRKQRSDSSHSFTDDDLDDILIGNSRLPVYDPNAFREMMLLLEEDEGDLDDEFEEDYDAWAVSLPFMILGTSARDVSSQPHVLSPPLMESLQGHLPLCKKGENFWMKYSMVRDGYSIFTFMKHARGAQYALLALETVDGEVFGAFTGAPWRKNWSYFGTGEAFLWRMRHSRTEKCHSVLDQARKESEIDAFHYTGLNRSIQLCTQTMIAVGGGEANGSLDSIMSEDTDDVEPHEWGFGLAIDGDMLTGTSSPCVTFGSPSLSKLHKDGTPFEIMNLELWTFTPCVREDDAEKLELGKLFLEENRLD